MATGNEYKNEEKTINDIVHGKIRLDSFLFKIIDSEQFQRLKYIKQLGAVYHVFPSANHTRFEHSIGVCFIAGKFIQDLKLKHNNVIDDVEVKCIKIASLCSQLKVGPLSQTFDFILDKKDYKKQLRTRNSEIFDEILKKCEIRTELQAYLDVEPNDLNKYIDLIKDLMDFNPYYENSKTSNVGKESENNLLESLQHFLDSKQLTADDLKKYIDEIIAETDKGKIPNNDGEIKKKLREIFCFLHENKYKYYKALMDIKYIKNKRDKSFLFEIIENRLNGIDCVTADYINRDCFYLGEDKKFDWKEIISSAKLGKFEDKNINNLDNNIQNINKCLNIWLIRNYIDDRIMQHIKNKGFKHICFLDNEKSIANISDMFYSRISLHQSYYKDKTVSAIELMYYDMLKNEELKNISRLRDDELFNMIKNNSIFKKIETRNLYINICSKWLNKPKCEKRLKIIQDSIIKTIETENIEWLQFTKKLDVEFFNLDNHKKSDKPIENIFFYKSYDKTDNIVCKNRSNDVSNDAYILKREYAQYLVYIYIKDMDQDILDRLFQLCIRDPRKKAFKNKYLTNTTMSNNNQPSKSENSTKKFTDTDEQNIERLYAKINFINMFNQNIEIPSNIQAYLLDTDLKTSCKKGTVHDGLNVDIENITIDDWKWNDFVKELNLEKIKLKFDNSASIKFNDNETMKNFFTNLYVNREDDVQALYQYHIISNMNSLLNAFDDLKEFKLRRMGKTTKGDKVPDFILEKNEQIKICIEIKTPWIIYNSNYKKARNKSEESDIREEFKQVIGYMKQYGVEYSILSNFVYHWFFKYEKDGGIEKILITEAKDLNKSENPSIYKCLLGLLYRCRDVTNIN